MKKHTMISLKMKQKSLAMCTFFCNLCRNGKHESLHNYGAILRHRCGALVLHHGKAGYFWGQAFAIAETPGRFNIC